MTAKVYAPLPVFVIVKIALFAPASDVSTVVPTPPWRSENALTGVPDAVPANSLTAFVVMVQSFVGLVPPSEVPRILRVSPLA